MTRPFAVQEVTAGPRRREHFVGVEIGPAIIRAGVYSESLRLVGKTKFSTKLERGPKAVIERVAKCILYAADECDLPLDRIQSIGVGVPGSVGSDTGLVELSPELGWKAVPLACELERRLSLPVFSANIHNLGTLGIYHHEARSAAGRFAALFLGPQIGGGLILDGELSDLSGLPVRPPLFEAPELNVFSTLPQAEFRHFRSRDFRKAIRKGNQAAVEFIREIATRTGQIAAQLVEQFAPEVIALGGGVLDEMKEEILRITETTARQQLGDEASVVFLPSLLGDLAGITGAAVWAAQRGTMLAGAPSPVVPVV
jgi:glucokinase